MRVNFVSFYVSGQNVMVSGTTTLLLLLALVSLAVASICPQGKQFLNYELQKCVNCTVCDSEKGMVVLTPCEVHQDTRCAPLSKLNLDWNQRDHPVENPHRHNHQKHHRRKEHNKNDRNSGRTDRGGDAEGRNTANGSGETGVSRDVSDGALDEDVAVGSGTGGTANGVTNSEVPFSSIEALVWDWQAIALTLAVFSCILFFLIIALYSLHQARQWRRLKENFEADVEELSLRLSLMAANCSEKGETLEPSFAKVRDINYLNNKCVYLEQLLNIRKDAKMGSEAAGNVYIEESNPTPTTGGKITATS